MKQNFLAEGLNELFCHTLGQKIELEEVVDAIDKLCVTFSTAMNCS